MREILAGNVARLYDFDLDALAPLAAEFGPSVDEIAEPIDAVPDKQLQRLSDDMTAPTRLNSHSPTGSVMMITHRNQATLM